LAVLPGKKYKPEDVLRIAWRRKWLIVAPFVVVSLATALVAWRLPDRYRSDTLILVVPQRVPESYVKSTVTTRIEDRLDSVRNQVLSRTRLERLILDFNLYPRARRAGIMEDIVEAMRKNIEVQVVRGDAFRIGFTYEDRRLAMEVVNKLAASFIDESNQDRTIFAESTTTFLETQLEDARRRLEDLEKKVAAYRISHAGELPTEREANLQALTNIQMQVRNVVESITRERERKYLAERVLADLTADTPPPQAAPAVGEASAEILSGHSAAEQLEAARTGLRSLELRFTPEHSDVKRMKRIIADLEVKAQQEALQRPVSPEGDTRYATPAEVQRQARIRQLRLEIEGIDRLVANGQQEEQALRAKIGEYQRRMEATPLRETELTSLLRDYDTVQNSYQSLLAKQEDSKIAANLEHRQIGEQFRTLDQARMPEKPISPNRPLIDLLGALFGLGVGLGVVALLEYRDDSFRTDEEVVNVLALPVVAVVPVMLSRAERARRRRRRMLVGIGAIAACLVAAAGAAWFFFLRG
jgi:polysaccharide chain length determinant protein (PEP-CTERM system associated)